MLAALALLLGLPLALTADPPGCAPLLTVTLDNATVPGVSPALSRAPVLAFSTSTMSRYGAGNGL